MTEPLSIAVVSDVICPWCYLGKRRLEQALATSGIAAEITWLPFELNPDMPPEGMGRSAYRAAKFGAERSRELDTLMTQMGAQEGVSFAFDRIARTPNTRLAHMLIAYATSLGLGSEAAQALFRAYFEEARDIGDVSELIDIASEIGIPPESAQAVLSAPEADAQVAAMEADAVRVGVTGVPFFIVDQKFAISGAQPAAAWIEALLDIRKRQGAAPDADGDDDEPADDED